MEDAGYTTSRRTLQYIDAARLQPSLVVVDGGGPRDAWAPAAPVEAEGHAIGLPYSCQRSDRALQPAKASPLVLPQSDARPTRRGGHRYGARAAETKAQSIEALAFWSKLDLNAIWTPPARVETHGSLADALSVASLGPDRRAAPHPPPRDPCPPIQRWPAY